MRTHELKCKRLIVDEIQSHDGGVTIPLATLSNIEAAAEALSATEWGALDGVTAGTVTASKALVVDANKDLATIRHLTLSGNLITGATTLSETDLMKIDGITNGTQAADKAVVADTNVNTGISKVTELHIGATGAEVQLDATPAQLNATQTDAGVMAHTVVDFNAAGTAAMTITINSVVYQEADVEDFPNGVWTNGASAANSATSLISAINGDTRAAVPFTAKADASGDGVVLTADAVGTAGNLTCASSDGTATTSNFLGGLDVASVVKASDIVHVVTAAEVLNGAVVIPTDFVPRCLQLTFLKVTTGAVLHLTSLVTIGSAPNSVIITADGATNLAAGDIVHLHATA